MASVQSHRSDQAGLANLLDDLRHDQELWASLRIVELGADYWKTGLRPRDAIIEDHRGNVRKVLRRLALAHLAKIIPSGIGPVAVLLNYQSAFGLGDQLRIPDLPVVPLTNDEETLSLSRHVTHILETEWPKLERNNPHYFQLHRLAQKRVTIPPNPPRRVPLYIAARYMHPDWLQERDLRGTDFVRAADSAHAAIIYTPPLGAQPSAQDLHAFASRIARSQANGTPYPEEKTQFDRYDDFITRLLAWEQPLWLCTCAVSDELTDAPLGTVMFFSTKAPEPGIAATANAMCFEVMNALDKIERRALAFVDTSRMVARWLSHESNDWFNALNNVKAQLASRVQQDTMAPESLTDICDKLADLSICAPRLIDLLNHFSGDARGTISADDFQKSLAAFMRMRSVQGRITMDLTTTERIPKGFQIIAFEFVRNAAKRFAVAADTQQVHVTLTETVRQLFLDATSWKHDSSHAKNLKACNQHAVDHHRGDVSGFICAMSAAKAENIGHWLIIRLAEQMGAALPEWEYEILPDGFLKVVARISRAKGEEDVST